MHFTDQIAEYIKEKEFKLSSLTIVLPSERAKKHLASSLFKSYGKPLIAPEMITMDKWVHTTNEFPVIDKTRLLLELFKIHTEQASSEIDFSFDEFMTWGTMLLSDFEEIDRYLVEAKDLFRNLKDIKEIEQWSFSRDPLTASQERFLQFWDRLPGYYHAFTKALADKQITSPGKAFRSLADNIQLAFKKDPARHFIFAGFNALSKSEKSIMRQLHVMGRGHILINADSYYLDNPVHEAGMFIRDLHKELQVKKLPFIESTLATKEMEVCLYECTQVTGQAKIMSTLLSGFSTEKINKTLVLLADETLVVPSLRNLPANIGKANITLGLPLKNTPVRSWVELLFNIQENLGRFSSKGLYFKDFIKIFNHPFTNSLLPETEKKNLIEFEKLIHKNNKIFIGLSNISEKIGPVAQNLLDELSREWNNDFTLAMSQVRRINQFVYSLLQTEFDFEKAVIQAFDAALIDLENIVTEGIPAMSLRSFKSLFNQHWGNRSVAYHGNPLEGLQIMGLLETRLLDFETIICLGMNEGTMPPTNPIQTIIPMDLRRYMQMPVPRDKQGLFAHHFYRLLHHCKELHVTYSKAQEKIGSNEKSRYLLQLELELARANPLIKIQHKYYTIHHEENEIAHEKYTKTPAILERMDEILAHSVSASLLKKYLTCPLDFYYRYILEFYESEAVEEEIQNASFGTAIHETLEELYRPFARFDKNGNKIDPAPPALHVEDLERMIKDFKYVLRNAFIKKFDGDAESINKGKNYLSFEMASKLTERFLQKEKKFLLEQSEPVFIHSLERTFEYSLKLEIAGKEKVVRLKGNIDRIDEIGNRVRIIDYKSGKVKSEDVCLKSNDNAENYFFSSVKTTNHVLQMLIYNYLFWKNENYLPDESLIMSFISGNEQHFPLKFNKNTDLNELMEIFPEVLKNILESMYDESMPFKHTTQMYNYCIYCE